MARVELLHRDIHSIILAIQIEHEAVYLGEKIKAILMAPVQETLGLLGIVKRSSAAAAAPHLVRLSTSAVITRRALTVNDTQKVTLGVIAAYVVGIALLWNLPYVRWVLWPFKVLPAPPR